MLSGGGDKTRSTQDPLDVTTKTNITKLFCNNFLLIICHFHILLPDSIFIIFNSNSENILKISVFFQSWQFSSVQVINQPNFDLEQSVFTEKLNM